MSSGGEPPKHKYLGDTSQKSAQRFLAMRKKRSRAGVKLEDRLSKSMRFLGNCLGVAAALAVTEDRNWRVTYCYNAAQHGEQPKDQTG
jgi:hypothetical protein